MLCGSRYQQEQGARLLMIQLFRCFAFSIALALSASCATAVEEITLSDAQAFDIPTYVARFDRTKPVIAVVAENTFTELTDYVVPYGILAQSRVADVYALGTQEGAVQLFPALRVTPQATIAQFDAKYPLGADYVIVPAVHKSDDSILINWITEQSVKGSTIVGVCDGVGVLANAGLLEGHSAVGHWYSFDSLARNHPNTTWVRNRRYLADKNIVTTTGVTASIPASIALVEAIAGTEKATSVATALNIDTWGVQHHSADFQLNARHAWVAATNWLAFWRKEKIGIAVEPGVNEVSLALIADAYSRTYRSKAYVLAQGHTQLVTKGGLTIELGALEERADFDRVIEHAVDAEVGSALDKALGEIRALYGLDTAQWVALQLEYADKL